MIKQFKIRFAIS